MNKYRKRIMKNSKQWTSKGQIDYINNAHQKLLSHIQLYKLKEEIKIYPSIQQKDNIQVSDTIKLFCLHSEKEGYSFDLLKPIKSSLQSIKYDDVVFRWDGHNYLYHTYKILGFIKDSFSGYLLSQDKELLKGTIGDFERAKQTYLTKYKKHKKDYNDYENTCKGNSLVNAILYLNLYYREKFTKQFLSTYALFGVDNIKALQNDNMDSNTFKKVLKVFMSGKVDKKDCANSLLCVLYFYMQFYMKVKKDLALQTVRNIVSEVYDISNEYKGSEVLTNIHVKEVIGSHVIYGFSPKIQMVSNSQKNRFQNIITNQTDIPEIDNSKFPNHIIKDSINNPLRLYSLLTPSELLQEMK